MKVVAMETRHWRNVAKLFKGKTVLHFFSIFILFSVSEIAIWEVAGVCPTEMGLFFLFFQEAKHPIFTFFLFFYNLCATQWSVFVMSV